MAQDLDLHFELKLIYGWVINCFRIVATLSNLYLLDLNLSMKLILPNCLHRPTVSLPGPRPSGPN